MAKAIHYNDRETALYTNTSEATPLRIQRCIPIPIIDWTHAVV